MAPTLSKSQPALGIELEGQRTAFYPGDIIVGKVHRRAPIVCTEARINLAFHGRTKSRMEVKNSNHGGIYRGRFTLLHQAQSVFAGPMHIPEGSPKQKEWPFALQIPQNIDSRLFPQQYDAKKSFTRIDPAYVGNQPLPASFYGKDRQTRHLNTMNVASYYDGLGSKEGFIEYYIEATLRFQRKGSWHEVTATMPIQILAFNLNPPVVDFHLQRTPRWGSVYTQRLVPRMENAELSTNEKMKKLFGANILLQAGLRLESWCDIRCDGYVRAHDTNWKEKLYLQSEAYGGRRVAVEIPCSDEAMPVDVGKALNIRIGGHAGTSLAFHDFTTFNVSLSHQLSWTARFEIAGEECTLHGVQPVKVLPQTSDRRPAGLTQPQSAPTQRAESWMAPPAEIEPPPTFAEYAKELGLQPRVGKKNLDNYGYPKEKQY
ncbi:unnamed protein product [Clonostachys rosea f. rosea IK726]|uniref:Uncharacterized protein n=1 Tax=Clonostachys rosea f. rosea IK726 TaxID=1349383 RepID=A0ACA9USK9_BIOOC|nr:unnamed protein product [Clonostachys rosea f. rosea IK726]